MSALLDYTTGRAAIAYAAKGGTPWHKAGTPLTPAEERSVALAAAAAACNFTVERQQATHNGQIVPGWHWTVRTDTGLVLGGVQKRYNVTQNTSPDATGAFDRMQVLLDRGLATVETAGALRDGRDSWMLFRLNLDSPVVKAAFGGADPIVPFVLVVNNHSGGRNIIVMLTPTRVVCWNTLSLATSKVVGRAVSATLDRAVKIRHTASSGERLDEAHKALLGDLMNAAETFAIEATLLRNTTLTEEEMGRLVLDMIAPLPSEAETQRQQTARAKIEAKRAEVTRLWTEGIGHTGNHSAWEALQGAVQSMEHDTDGRVWQTKGDGHLASAFDGSIARNKLIVTNSLLEHVVATQQGRSLLERLVDSTASASALDRILAVHA